MLYLFEKTIPVCHGTVYGLHYPCLSCPCLYLPTHPCDHVLFIAPSCSTLLQLQESLDLDPRGRNAAVCLAHLSCFASANAAANANETPRASTRLQWNALDDRTQEVLRVLALGVSSGNDDVLREGVGRFGEGREFDLKRGAFGDEESGGAGGVEARILLACVARARGDDGEAVSMFRKALALDPNCLEGE